MKYRYCFNCEDDFAPDNDGKCPHCGEMISGSFDGISPEIAMLVTHLRHVTYVRAGLERIRADIYRRSIEHDVSKLSPEEFPGFLRINSVARSFTYGSDEYKNAMKSESGVVKRHQLSNSHHPEYHSRHALVAEDVPASMGFMDIIEMVVDWWAASMTYGGNFAESLAIQKKRWKWSKEQWWLIVEVAHYLSPGTVCGNSIELGWYGL